MEEVLFFAGTIAAVAALLLAAFIGSSIVKNKPMVEVTKTFRFNTAARSELQDIQLSFRPTIRKHCEEAITFPNTVTVVHTVCIEEK